MIRASDLAADALYFSRSVGFKRLLVVCYREPRSAARLLTIGKHQCPSEMIQSGTQIMSDISYDATPAVRGNLYYTDAVGIASSLRVVISDNFVWAAFMESANL